MRGRYPCLLRKLDFVIPPDAVPQSSPPAAADRLRLAWQQRHESDYIFGFWSAFGWMLLTGGIYALFVVYQLVRRSRDHNRRRLELLDAAATFAWEQAQARGITEELRPEFQRVSDRMRVLRDLTAEFRDPALWVVLTLVSGGLAEYLVWILLDGDLVRHDEAERAIETDLAAIYARLGQPIAVPDPTPLKGRHNVGGRVVATLVSLGVYAIWWMRDVMIDGNEHFVRNWRFEDDLAHATQSLLAVRT